MRHHLRTGYYKCEDLVRSRLESGPRRALKARTTTTNRWLGAALNMGGLHEVSRQVSAWHRQPDPLLAKKLGLTTNYKA